MPEPKNGERPYLAVPVPLFLGLIFAIFWHIFNLTYCLRFSSTHHQHPAHTRTLHLYTTKPVLGICNTHYTTNSIHTNKTTTQQMKMVLDI